MDDVCCRGGAVCESVDDWMSGPEWEAINRMFDETKAESQQETEERLEREKVERKRCMEEKAERRRLKERQDYIESMIRKSNAHAPMHPSLLSLDMQEVVNKWEADVLAAAPESLPDTLRRAADDLASYMFVAHPNRHPFCDYIISKPVIGYVLIRAAISRGIAKERAIEIVKQAIEDRVARGELRSLSIDFDIEPQAEGWTFDDPLPFITTAAPDPDWVIPGVLMRGDNAALVAEGGSGKTFWAIQVAALGLTTGRGSLPTFAPDRPCRVMLLLSETSKSVTHKRIEGILKGLEWTPTDTEIDHYRRNLKILSGISEPLLHVVEGAAKTTDRFQWLVKHVKAWQPDLLVIDPKAKWDATNENDNAHQAAFVAAMDELIRAGAGAVLVIHHVNKGHGATAERMTSDWARGASAFRDACRAMLGMRKLTPARVKAILNAKKQMPESWCCRYVEIDLIKINNWQSWTKPVILKWLSDGGFVEVDLEDEANRTDDDHEESLEAVAQEIGSNSEGMTDRNILKGEGEGVKRFYARIRARLDDPNLTDTQIRSLYAAAKEADRLKLDKGNGRAKIPRYASNVDGARCN